MKLSPILLVDDNEGDSILMHEAFEERKMITELSLVKNGQEDMDFVFTKGIFNDSKNLIYILLDINIPIFNRHEVQKKYARPYALKDS